MATDTAHEALKLNPAVRWEVKIATPSAVLVDLKDVDYATARAAFDEILASTQDDTLKARLLDCVGTFGFGGSYGGGYAVQTGAGLSRVDTGERHLCPRRSEGGPGPQLSTDDKWEKLGGDRVCSYCGSLHPDDMLARMKEKGLAAIDPSNKGYKWYLKDGAMNARLGAIKYYRMHDTPELVAEVKRLVDEYKASTASDDGA